LFQLEVVFKPLEGRLVIIVGFSMMRCIGILDGAVFIIERLESNVEFSLLLLKLNYFLLEFADLIINLIHFRVNVWSLCLGFVIGTTQFIYAACGSRSVFIVFSLGTLQISLLMHLKSILV
jgi:hypothetical protein